MEGGGRIITANDMEKFAIIYCYENKTGNEIKSLEFHHKEDFLLSAQNDRMSILTYHEDGQSQYHLRCRKGIDLMKIVGDNLVAHSILANNSNFISILDFKEKKYLQSFKGHKGPVNAISTSDDLENLILTSSQDFSVRLWDKRKQFYAHKATFEHLPIVAYHPGGLLFAVGIDSQWIEIYHLKGLRSPIIRNQILNKSLGLEWKALKYSQDGNILAISSNANFIFIIDAPTAALIHIIKDFENFDVSHYGVSFDQFGSFIWSGSSDGFLHAWDYKNVSLEHHKFVVCENQKLLNVAFSPVRLMLATSNGSEMKLWHQNMD